jgi:hypothetical protein
VRGSDGRHRGASATRGAGGAAPLYLIHTNNCSNPVSMRVAARFDAAQGLPLELLTDSPAALSWVMGWRAAHGAKSTA